MDKNHTATYGSAPCPTTPTAMLLTPRDAARSLAMCERTLWTLTKRGDVRAVRFGRAVRYDPADLRRWIEKAKGHEGSHE